MEKLKLLVMISFLAIPIPGKIILINGIGIVLSIISIIGVVFIEPLNKELVKYSLMTIISIIGIIIIFKKNRAINLIGICMQYLWLFFIFKKNDLNNLSYLIVTVIYLLISLVFCYKLFNKHNNQI